PPALSTGGLVSDTCAWMPCSEATRHSAPRRFVLLMVPTDADDCPFYTAIRASRLDEDQWLRPRIPSAVRLACCCTRVETTAPGPLEAVTSGRSSGRPIR